MGVANAQSAIITLHHRAVFHGYHRPRWEDHQIAFFAQHLALLGAENVFAASLDEEEKREAKVEFGERGCGGLRDWKYGNFTVHEASLVLLVNYS